MVCLKTVAAVLALTALGFQIAHLVFFFVAKVSGETCSTVGGLAGACSPIDTGDAAPKVFEVAIGKDVTQEGIGGVTLTVDVPPAPPILNALVWAATSLFVGLVSAICHLLPQCAGSPRCLQTTLSAVNFLCVCPAFSYLATTRYTTASAGIDVETELKPSFAWGTGMNLGAALTLLVLVALNACLVKASPAAPRNVDVEAAAAAPKPRPAPAAAPKPAPKPKPRYNAEALSAA